MADDLKIRIEDLPSVSSINDSDIIPTTQENEELFQTKKATVKDIGDHVATEQEFSTLNTTAKTLVAAINELQSAGISASDVTYDPTTSGLEATNVQSAIDEIVAMIRNLVT